MTAAVSVLVPYRPDGGARDRVWEWMSERWRRLLPEFELVVAGDGATDGPFNEGAALNAAARAAHGDVLVVAESEVAFNSADLRAATFRVAAAGGWLLPARYHALTEEATRALLAGDATAPIGEPAPGTVERSWVGTSVAPILVVSAEAYWLTGGWDDRYHGWGWTDRAFAAAAGTLYGRPGRYSGSVFHLWHPRGPAHDCNPPLSERYRRADGDPAAMRALVGEPR